MSEILNKLISGLSDPASLLPELAPLLEKLVPLCRITVMAAPVAMLVLGLVYLLLAPKEANHHLGFRFWWAMGSVEVWQFTQKLAGIVWGALGLVMSLVMYFLSNGYAEMGQDEMLFAAVTAIVWELAIVVVSILAIQLTVVILFTSKGDKRSVWVNRAPAKK